MRKGSIREKSKPIISLKNLSEDGVIVVPKNAYRHLESLPDSWVSIKPSDILISQSGTIRLVLRKNWQEGEAETLRITWEQHNESLEASLEVEKIDIDSSNFDFLSSALRPVSGDLLKHEYKPAYFTRAVRYNILSFLGFGKIGNSIHSLLPDKNNKRAAKEIILDFLLDKNVNTLTEICNDSEKDKPRQENLLRVSVKWSLNERIKTYQISEINYPPGVSATTLETLTLASEIANTFSLANEIHSIKKK